MFAGLEKLQTFLSANISTSTVLRSMTAMSFVSILTALSAKVFDRWV